MCELVSIIMPSYNTGAYISETIHTVIGQTYRDWELIIVDDCSSDNTDEVVRPFLVDNRIRYIKNDQNSGAAASRNRALRAAKGKWIAFLDSDDLWYPDKLEKQIRFMKTNNHHFSYTYYEEIDSEGNASGIKMTGPKRIGHAGFVRYCWPGCLTVMYDREIIGLIQVANIKKNNDYAMWLKASERADCYLLPELLAKYRKGRSGSVSTESISTMIGWHYKLFHDAEEESAMVAGFHTFQNLAFGALKKILYRRALG